MPPVFSVFTADVGRLYTKLLLPVSNLVPKIPVVTKLEPFLAPKLASKLVPWETFWTELKLWPEFIVTSKMYNLKCCGEAESCSKPLALAVPIVAPLEFFKFTVVKSLMSGVPSHSLGSNLI